MNPILSFVVIEYFSMEEIDKCIESITSTVSGIPYEIIISSNSQYSISKKKEIIRRENTRWIFNNRNGGFAYGMNRGLAVSKGKYRIIMNPDVKIIDGLSSMVNFMDRNPSIGAIGPRIISESGEIQDSCRPYVSIESFFARTIRRIVEHKTAVLSNNIDYNLTQTVDWVIGAFILVRDNVVLETNGLDENYFMYAEDLDWCTRIRKIGYEIVYFPKAVVEYKGSRSARRSYKYAKIFFKSHFRYWRNFGFLFGYPKRNKIFWYSDG